MDRSALSGWVLRKEKWQDCSRFAPEVEEDAYLPQVKRKLIIRAEKITAFSHALRCDDIQQLAEAKGTARLFTGKDSGSEVPVCTFAPEWAEHARFGRSDEPCDDGRAGGSLRETAPG